MPGGPRPQQFRSKRNAHNSCLAQRIVDFIKAGTLHAITAQSAESDGAVPMQLAAEWFSGKTIPEVRYLPIRIITKENVDAYLPPQW